MEKQKNRQKIRPIKYIPIFKIMVSLNGKFRYPAVLNIGAQISVMTRDVAEAANLPVVEKNFVRVISHSGHTSKIIGVAIVSVDIGGIVNDVYIYVVKQADISLILGQPFYVDSKIIFDYKNERIVRAKIKKKRTDRYIILFILRRNVDNDDCEKRLN